MMGIFGFFGRGRPSSSSGLNNDLMLKIRDWLTAPSLVAMRRYLEQHPELLQDATEQFFKTVIARGQADQPDLAKLQDELEISKYARAHGGTRQAIRDAYTETKNAFDVLDFPPWLERVRSSMNQCMSVTDMINRLRSANQRARQDAWVVPEVVASLEGMTVELVLQEDSGDASPESVSMLEHALTVFTPGRFPKTHASTQRMLGLICYRSGRENGDPDLLNKAIPYLKASSQPTIRSQTPDAWALLQMSIADVWLGLGRPICAKKYFVAALEVFTCQRHPRRYEYIREQLEHVEMSLLQAEELSKSYERISNREMADFLRGQIHIDDNDC
jgi:hypothetical protein